MIKNPPTYIQGKLFQCQQLLTEYQAQILNKQDRLNTSIAGLKLAIGKPVMTASPRKDTADPKPSDSKRTEYLKPRIKNRQRQQVAVDQS